MVHPNTSPSPGRAGDAAKRAWPGFLWASPPAQEERVGTTRHPEEISPVGHP